MYLLFLLYLIPIGLGVLAGYYLSVTMLIVLCVLLAVLLIWTAKVSNESGTGAFIGLFLMVLLPICFTIIATVSTGVAVRLSVHFKGPSSVHLLRENQ